jgi:hypothetical protein
MLAYVRLNQKKYDKLGGWHIYIWPNLNGHHEALLFIFFNYHQGIIYIYIYIYYVYPTKGIDQLPSKIKESN